MNDFALTIALVGVLGIGAQWVAWRTSTPAIALMLLAGLIAGPVLGLINPEENLGHLLEPLVAVAVAIILFEGGLNLKFNELHRSDGAVERLVVLGVPIGWALGAAAGYYVAGLVWPVAILFAGILVVTGPTVVLPLLRQTSVDQRPRAILKWEAIVNDPIGALCAVIAYEWLRQSQTGGTVVDNLLVLATAAAVAGLLGYAAARAIAWAFPRGMVPEYLKAPVLLVAVIATFVLAEAVYHETGLLTVTILGMALANMRLASAPDFMRFKENVTVLLVSGVFVLLSASLDLETFERFEWRFLAFVAVLIVLVRPATVLLSLAFSTIPWRERLFVSAVAPRGIVAVAISGLFALRLDDLGYGDGGTLVALSFAVVAGTIVVYGFAIGPLARALGLTDGERPGLLIVGSTSWSISFAEYLLKLGVPVTIADRSWQRLSPARARGLTTYHGEILAEATEEHLDLDRFQALVATSENEAYNALVCTEFSPEIGRDAVYQLGDAAGDDPRSLPDTLRGRALFSSGVGVEDIDKRHAEGWQLQTIHVFDLPTDCPDTELELPPNSDPLLILGQSGTVRFFTHASRPKPKPGDKVIVHVPPRSPRGSHVETQQAEGAPA
jgi:NhaP-type Na+/H+ or K+/H+ antiporter